MQRNQVPTSIGMGCRLAAESGADLNRNTQQVQDVRNWVFLPKLRFDSMDALNAHLQTECGRLAERKHPTIVFKRYLKADINHLLN